MGDWNEQAASNNNQTADELKRSKMVSKRGEPMSNKVKERKNKTT